MEKNKNNIILIIPAYNEEESILATYNEIERYNHKHQKRYDILVVNDGSSDNTEQILQSYDIPHLQLKQNLGLGAAMQAGYKYANLHDYDIAVQFDADGQHDINYVEDLCSPILLNNASQVIGSRFVNGGKSKYKSSNPRRVGIKIISWLIKIFTGVKIYDTTSGFRATNKDTTKMFSENYFSEYTIAIVRLAKLNKKIVEVPVNMHERIGGVSSINFFKSIYFMLNVCMHVIIEAIAGYKYNDKHIETQMHSCNNL